MSASIFDDFYKLVYSSYKFITITYPDILSKKVKPPFFIDLKQALLILSKHNSNYIQICFALIFGVFLISFIRKFIVNYIIQNLIRRRIILVKDEKKLSESCWSFLFYLNSFTLSAIIVHSYGCLTYPELIWQDYSIDGQVPILVQILYFFETSFYFHSLYAVFWVNEWKIDSIPMFFHHIVAILLLAFSYLTRTHLMGVLMLYLHDICDIFLDGIKILVKLQFVIIQSNQDILKIIGFSLFIIAWFLNRLYYYPFVVLTTSYKFTENNIQQPWWIFLYILYILLWVIFLLNVYWAMLILILVLKVLLGRQEIHDLREIEQNESSEQEHPKEN